MIVFTGRMGYFPNSDAAVHFACDVMPLIRAADPSAHFVIVGADMPNSAALRCRGAGALVTGHVPSIHDWLTRASVAVAPMRAGSGMQFKVLEAMASGAPVVATRFGLGGLRAIGGEHLLVANSAVEIAEEVVRLLRDRTLADRLAINARSLVERNYSWESSIADLEQIYDHSVLKRRRRTEATQAQPEGEVVAAD
ncbi:MAG: glycosyltransferase family 4 protein [Candidatus Binataceae bacterium]